MFSSLLSLKLFLFDEIDVAWSGILGSFSENGNQVHPLPYSDPLPRLLSVPIISVYVLYDFRFVCEDVKSDDDLSFSRQHVEVNVLKTLRN